MDRFLRWAMTVCWSWLILNLAPLFPLWAQDTALETYCDGVIDAWTLHSPDFGEIRFLGIEPLEAREKVNLEEKIRKDLSSRVEGKKIRLEFEGASEDSRGRLLAYVLDGETLINGWMLKNGYARVSHSLRPFKHQQLFSDLQKEAQENHRGIWELSKASSAQIVPPRESAKAMVEKNVATETAETQPASPPAKAKIIASKKSRYYYRPGQYYYNRVEPRHRVYFDTEQDARRAGFRPYLKD